MIKNILILVILLLAAAIVSAQTAAESSDSRKTDAPSPIEYALIHPLFTQYYSCGEHWEGQLSYLGDSLGSDCVIMGGLPADEKSGFVKPYKTNGKTNEDWYGWMQPVLSPISGTVVKVNVNPVVNKPGTFGRSPAGFVIFEGEDGTKVLVAHVTEISVKVGDKVIAGVPFAKMGNNGFGRNPHIHVGAWRGETPLQIRFDLRAAAGLHKSK